MRTVAVMLLMSAFLLTAATADVEPLDELKIFAVQDGEPAQVIFSAPPRLATRTLTDTDVRALVDGRRQDVRLQRLTANDLELAVVIDTTLPAEDVRAIQGAVVELALKLPQGATMRIIDARAVTSEPTPVPGPAIAAIRTLQAGTGDDLQTAVSLAGTLLSQSASDRTALLVVGQDLGARIQPIDDRPLSSLTYVVDVGDGRARELLGPRTSGHAVDLPSIDRILTAADDIAQDLRTLYRAEVAIPDPAAKTLTLEITAGDGDSPAITLALDPNSVRPVQTDPVDPVDPAAGDQVTVPGDGTADSRLSGDWIPWLMLGAAVLAAVVAVGLWFTQSERPEVPAAADETLPPLPKGPTRPSSRRPSASPRPIAKLAPATREALAHAHLGLRQLALASRATADAVPDEMFRLTEARASAALSGRNRSLDEVLTAALDADGTDTDVELIWRAATALSTGWQHTERRQSAPPAVLEINAVLTGAAPKSTKGPSRPVAPVRALNPLVDIGLEHLVLMAQPGPHSGLVARAVTTTDIMRAARLARPVLTLSPFLLAGSDRYEAARQAEPTDPDERDRWLQFLCEGIGQSSSVSVDRLRRLERLRTRFHRDAVDVLQIRLADLLLARPIVDEALIARRTGVSEAEAAALCSAASDARWLRPHDTQDRVWVAEAVLTVFTDPAIAAREPSSQSA